MKKSETESARLTEREGQSYAKAMPESPEKQVAQVIESDSSEESLALAEILRKAEADLKDYKAQKKQQEEQDKRAEEEKANKEEKEAIKQAEDLAKDKPEADSEKSPKASLLGKLFGVFAANVPDEKLLAKAKDFSEGYGSLKEENINALKSLFTSWETDSKDHAEINLCKTAQLLVLEVVKEKGVSTTVFLEAVKNDAQLKGETIEALSQLNTSSKVEQVLEGILYETMIEDPSDWDTGRIAKHYVKLQKAAAESGELVDTKVSEVLEDFLMQTVIENNISDSDFTTAVEEEVFKESKNKQTEPVARENDKAEEKKEETSSESGEKSTEEIHAFVQSEGDGDSSPSGIEDYKDGHIGPQVVKMGADNKRGDNLEKEGAFNNESLDDMLAEADEIAARRARMDEEIIEGQEEWSVAKKGAERKAVKFRQKVKSMNRDQIENMLEKGYLKNKRNDTLTAFKKRMLKKVEANGKEAWVPDSDRIQAKSQELTQIFNATKKRIESAMARKLNNGQFDPAGLIEAQNLSLELLNRMHREQMENFPLPERKDGGRMGQIHNFNDLCEQIGRTDDRFAPGGEYELIDLSGKLHEENFLIWVRDKMLYLHNEDPDSPINFFGQIEVESSDLYRTVSLQSMLRGKNLYYKTRDGEPLENLNNEVTNLVWLIGTLRNMNIEYRLNMNPAEKIGELMNKLMNSDLLSKKSATKSNTLEAIFTMAARNYDNAAHELDSDEESAQRKPDMELGDGIAVALEIYYNITDHEKLKQVFGKDTSLFKRKGMDQALKKVAGVGKYDDENTKRAKILDVLLRSKLIEPGQTYEDFITLWYGSKDAPENADLTKDGVKKQTGMMNVFLPEPNPQQSDLTQQLIIQTISEVISQSTKKDADLATASFAQLVASFMTWWGGAAAKADIKVNAVNAMSRLKWVRSYKRKSTDPSRAGPVGNIYGMGNLQEIYSDVLTGLQTTNGKSIMEIVGEKIDDLKHGATFAEKEATAHQLNFDVNQAKQKAAAHDLNVNKIYLMEDYANMPKFHDFVTVNQWGTARIDADTMAEKFQDAIIKPTRYAWSTFKMPFHKDVRKLIDDPKSPHEGEYVTVSQLENTFSRQVLGIIQDTFTEDMHHGFNIDKSDKGDLKYQENYKHVKFYDKKAGRVYRFRMMRDESDPDPKKHKMRYLGKDGKFLDDKLFQAAHGGHVSETEILIKHGVKEWEADEIFGRLKANTDEEKEWKQALLDSTSEMPKEITKLMDNKIFRCIVVRSFLVAKFGGMLYGASIRSSPYKYLDILEREHAIEGLENILLGAVADEEDFTKNYFGGKYFSHHDMQRIRRLSHNEKWRNFSTAFGKTMGSAGWASLKELLQSYFKNMVS